MAARDRAIGLLSSVVAHLAAAALVLRLPTRIDATPPLAPLSVTELSFEAPREPAPRASARPAAPDPRPTPTAPRVIAPRPPVAPRAAAARAPSQPPTAQEPTPPAPEQHGPPVIPTPPRSEPRLALRVTDLLRASDAHLAMPASPSPAGGATARGALFEGSSGSDLERARAATQGYVREVLDASSAREAPGVRAYLWSVRRRVSEVWRPGVVRVPNLAETLLSGFLAPERAMRILGQRVMRRQRQILEAPRARLGGAVDAIEAIGGVAGNGPTMRQTTPADASDESWRRNSRTTRVEVQVDQDANGRVLDVRVVRSSGMAAFDRAAITAVREGVDAQDPVPLPGGRSSRWSFTVVATRRLFAPSIGGSFDESRGWFRVELPGQVSVRSRVQMESSAPLERAGAT